MELSLREYARLAAELVAAGAEREAVLSRHGLDEERWEEIDSVWQDRLSEAMAVEGDEIPAILGEYAAAYAEAQRQLAKPMTLEQYADVTRLLQARGDLSSSLAKVGVKLSDFIQASEQWSRRLVVEPELADRFQELLQGKRKSSS